MSLLGKANLNWSTCIITAPRQHPTLLRCMQNLQSAGWRDFRIFAEPGCEDLPRDQGIPIVERVGSLGAWPNWYLALAELLMRQPNADFYFLLEDDALLYQGQPNLKSYVEQSLVSNPQLAFASLYCADAIMANQIGWVSGNLGKYFIGALALVIPKESALKLMTNENVARHRETGGEDHGTKLTDAVLGRWAFENQLRVLVHNPSLVDHIGNTSTLGNDNQKAFLRNSKSFLQGQADHQIIWNELNRTELPE